MIPAGKKIKILIIGIKPALLDDATTRGGVIRVPCFLDGIFVAATF